MRRAEYNPCGLEPFLFGRDSLRAMCARKPGRWFCKRVGRCDLTGRSASDHYQCRERGRVFDLAAGSGYASAEQRICSPKVSRSDTIQ